MSELDPFQRLKQALAIGLSVVTPLGYAATKATGVLAQASPLIPTGAYKCPQDYLNLGYAPIKQYPASPKIPNDTIGAPDLTLTHDNSMYNLGGDAELVSTKCTGSAYEQYQVRAVGIGQADNPRFYFKVSDSVAGIAIHDVVEARPDQRAMSPGEVVKKPLADCAIAADRMSVVCSLGSSMNIGEERVIQVHYTASKPARDELLDATVESDQPDLDPADNSASVKYDFYPQKVNNFTASLKPRFINGKYKKINRRCGLYPVKISSPFVTLYGGSVEFSVTNKPLRKQGRSKLSRTIVRFTELSEVPIVKNIKVCDLGRKKVDLGVKVKAVNTSDGAPFTTQAHLVGQNKKNTKKHFFAHEPWS